MLSQNIDTQTIKKYIYFYICHSFLENSGKIKQLLRLRPVSGCLYKKATHFLQATRLLSLQSEILTFYFKNS